MSLKRPGWNAAIVRCSMSGVAVTAFGTQIFRLSEDAFNAPLGTWAAVKSGRCRAALASSACSFHYLSESVCAEPEAGSQARELFCCVRFSVKGLFLKGSREWLDFDFLCRGKGALRGATRKILDSAPVFGGF